MKAITFVLTVFCPLAVTARASDSDDTLRFYMAKSDLVVSGTIISEPTGIVHEAGVTNWICKVKVKDTLHGETRDENTIDVNIVRFDSSGENHPSYLAKGSECILFLNNVSTTEKPPWKSADMWFGIQPFFSDMERSIQRLSKIDEKK